MFSPNMPMPAGPMPFPLCPSCPPQGSGPQPLPPAPAFGPPPQAQPLGPQPTINSLNDANVGVEDGGFALDTNNNGQYDRGTDGVLAFDLNHDGQVEDEEVSQSKSILNARDNPTIEIFGKEITNPAYAKAEELGLTGEGPLTGDQLAQAGGRVLTDQNDGSDTGFLGLPKPPEWNTSSVYNFPSGNGQQGSLSSLDPMAGYATSNPAY